jgi:hypothetical protein
MFLFIELMYTLKNILSLPFMIEWPLSVPYLSIHSTVTYLCISRLSSCNGTEQIMKRIQIYKDNSRKK